MTDNEEQLEFVEGLMKLMDKHRVDSLEFYQIKLTKKHPPKPISIPTPKKNNKSNSEVNDQAQDIFSDPDFYAQTL